jgi:magnesium-transporting ATPase (P-type)
VTEKERIEATPLDKLTFTDVYTFPFKSKSKSKSWVFDSQDNFIFQFCVGSKQSREKFLSILNNTVTDYNRHDTRYVDGYIELRHLDEWVRFILIRGWGSLTSSGGYNLTGEYASKIQDSLAEYIIDKLK